MKQTVEENIYALIDQLKHFEYRLEVYTPVWDLIFPDSKNKYRHISISKDLGNFYLHHNDGNDYWGRSLSSLEIKQKKSVTAIDMSFRTFSHFDSSDPLKDWEHIIIAALAWLKYVKKNWIKAAQDVYASYPLNRRRGIAPSSVIHASLPEIYKVYEDLGKRKTRQFVRLVEERYFWREENTVRESMTANDYFEYCRIAYISGKRKEDHVDESLSGREMYERYADGRDEGLLDIDPDSSSEFAAWIDGTHPKRDRGGHPWEIKRGGNTTHIDLWVSRPSYGKDNQFTVSLCGASFTRLKETICMFLGIQQAGLPISIDDPEGIRKRLLAQDNMGIIPCHHSLHRANQKFHEHETVYDVLHFDDLGRYKKRILPFITWEPLPILKPVN